MYVNNLAVIDTQCKYYAYFWQWFKTAQQLCGEKKYLISFKSAKNQTSVFLFHQHRLECLLPLAKSSHGFTLNFCHGVSRQREQTASLEPTHSLMVVATPAQTGSKTSPLCSKQPQWAGGYRGEVIPTFLIGHGCRTNWCSWHVSLLDQVFHQFWFHGPESLY